MRHGCYVRALANEVVQAPPHALRQTEREVLVWHETAETDLLA